MSPGRISSATQPADNASGSPSSMRTSGITVLALLSSTLIHAQGAPVELRGALPAEQGVVAQVVYVEPGARTLFVSQGGDLVLYDQSSHSSSHLATGVWDVTISPKRDLIAYVKGGEAR